MKGSKPKALYVLLAVLLVGLVLTEMWIQPTHDELLKAAAPKGEDRQSGDIMVQLPAQFIVATATGFREAVAGLLWVRADEFFHKGQYQAIIPVVRMVTWLDPHQIDVYTTGAWHLDYNFVDENSRSDKRYISPAIALLKDGIKNNPNIWDLYFELGWTHYNRKLFDFEKGLECLEKACQLDGIEINTGKKAPRPEYVDRMLAHQYEKVGRFDDAITHWKKTRARTLRMIKDRKTYGPFVDQTSVDVCDRNMGLLLMRLGWRYGDMKSYKEGLDIYKQLSSRKDSPADVKAAMIGAEKEYNRRVAENNPPRDALKPLDAGFEVTLQKMAPRVIKISGKVNLIPASEYKDLAVESITNWYKSNEGKDANAKAYWQDGARVNWMLTDYDYIHEEMDTFDWKIDLTKTVTWDTLYIKGGQFSDVIELKNTEFYPLIADKYKLVVWLTPQDGGIMGGCPDYIQDRIGWKGEALTDSKYLDVKTKPGYKMLRREFVIERDQLL